MKNQNEMSVLYVEDEPLIAMETEDFLHDMGFEDITVCHTYDGAKKAVNAKRYDVAVMDMNLNGTLSLPLVETLNGAGTRVLIATAYDSVTEGFVRAGVSKVQKPFSEESLRKAMNDLLEGAEKALA